MIPAPAADTWHMSGWLIALHKINGKGDEKVVCRGSFERQKNVMKRMLKTIIGILILVVGISIFLYPDYREWKNHREITRITKGFPNDDMPDSIHQEKETKVSSEEEKEISSEQEMTENGEQDQEPGSSELFTALKEYNAHLITEGQDITDAWNFRQSPVDVAALNHGSSAVGYIEIPEISISLPLYIGATESNMSSGAVVLTETSMPVGGDSTNCVIAAHRGWKGSPYFRDIDQLKVGSRIHIHNLWEDLTYQVTGTEIIHATECGILNIREGKDMVTLFSCYPYMSPGTKYRLVIYCEREKNADTKEPMPDTQHQKGTTVKELAENELADKGIVIGESFTEAISRREDLIRLLLPAACILLLLVVSLFRLKRRR